MREKGLNFFSVALMYVGAIMGAGFASGREIWQFFGVFGSWGYIGVIAVGILYILAGIMTSIIARKLGTNDMGRVIVPGGHPGLVSFTGGFMACILFTVLIGMSAAGGSLFSQQFGMNPILGGVLITVLVTLTVIGGFQRVSQVFRFIMPILFCVVMIVCFLVIWMDLPPSNAKAVIEPSPLTPNWITGAVIYVSYNMLAIIPIVATASIHARSGKHAIGGAALGGVFLAALAFVLVHAMMTDPQYSQMMDMPMLGYSERISAGVNLVYAIVLLCAIYASATSNYYGFTTKLKNTSKKNGVIIVMAWVGFAFGLMGFKNVVAYLFPAEGILGILIIIMLVTNFIKVIGQKQNKERQTEMKVMFDGFEEGYNRFAFPQGVKRVTAGHGGEAILIVTEEKTALFDCGMAYCAEELIENIKAELKDRPLDYVLMSHTHYDHIGALPWIRKAYPQVVSYGSEHGKKVLTRPGALRVIKELGEAAKQGYAPGSRKEIITDGLSVDRAVGQGDRIPFGEGYFAVLETKGHTDCSLTYVWEPKGIMFASESTGIPEESGFLHTAILKDFQDAMKAADRCSQYGAKQVIFPHYGVLPESGLNGYWNRYKETAQAERDFVVGLGREGKTYDEILAAYSNKYWTEAQEKEQPRAAFDVNAKHIVEVMLREMK